MPGHIASVLTPYEQGFIFSTLYDYKDAVVPGTKVWLGLYDRDVSLFLQVALHV